MSRPPEKNKIDIYIYIFIFKYISFVSGCIPTQKDFARFIEPLESPNANHVQTVLFRIFLSQLLTGR